ncbi:MAG TPA: hypothetical protein VKR06_10115 [Ktedonosporobacter sp.]|nr:hypothetical protein [Ktedonosporobacter sp.]
MEDLPPHLMSLAMLAERCRHEVRKTRGEEPSTDRYCLEIFDRAIIKHDEQAWNLLTQSFHGLMMAWFYRHPDRDRALRYDSAQNYVGYAFTRFWQATRRNQDLAFQSLSAALSYLKASLNGAVKDTLRAHARQEMRLPESGTDFTFEEPAAEEVDDGQDLWEAIVSLLPSEREQRVAYLIIHCGLKPREIIQRCPGEFSDVYEIYRLYRNVYERLIRNADQLRWRLDDEEH